MPDWQVIEGDCVEQMRGMAEASVDAVVCDPPAGISFMGRGWDHHRGGLGGWTAWMAEVMAEALRVCKPGAHAFVWALPRTSHWTGLALERAGWQVRDIVTHLFGSGFPKSHNLPNGWGTALKPSAEFWFLARKPLSGTVSSNVLEFGTGALNVDACRIEGAPELRGRDAPGNLPNGNGTTHGAMERTPYEVPVGRWPANVVMDQEAAEALPAEDGVSVSRFFFCAKSSTSERSAGLDGDRNIHPTCKPVSLMRWLVRLVTPPGGTVLDPFAGSGTTGAACMLEGFRFVGIEREPEYAAIARARIEWWSRHPDGVEIVKALEAERDRKAIADTGQMDLFGT